MKSVLVVEDDATLRGAMQMVLEWEGYRVVCASNGHEALNLLSHTDRPSLILLDLMLPVLDGWQFRQAIKDDPRLAAIPVVVVSALDAWGSVDAASHVQKPFRPEELLDAVRRQTG